MIGKEKEIEFLVLSFIKRHGENGWRSCRAGTMYIEFNRNLDGSERIAKGSIHRAIGELKKEGFVECRDCPDAVSYLDSVTQFCTLTEAGAVEVESRWKRIRRFIRRIEQAARAGGLWNDERVG